MPNLRAVGIGSSVDGGPDGVGDGVGPGGAVGPVGVGVGVPVVLGVGVGVSGAGVIVGPAVGVAVGGLGVWDDTSDAHTNTTSSHRCSIFSFFFLLPIDPYSKKLYPRLFFFVPSSKIYNLVKAGSSYTALKTVARMASSAEPRGLDRPVGGCVL